MFNFLKYLPQILLKFKDVSASYAKETGEERPFYLSRTFVFSALCFIATLITAITGTIIDENFLGVLADNIPTIISGIIAIIGAVLSFIAQWKRND